jgi:hypothetical protein
MPNSCNLPAHSSSTFGKALFIYSRTVSTFFKGAPKNEISVLWKLEYAKFYLFGSLFLVNTNKNKSLNIRIVKNLFHRALTKFCKRNITLIGG